MTTPTGDPEVDQPLPVDPIAAVMGAPARMWTRQGVTNLGPRASDLPPALRAMLGDRTDLIALSGVLWGAVSALFNRLGPLQNVADQMPVIVTHSDAVHTELQQGLEAIRTAVGSIQQASANLATSLTSITQLAAQAQASAAIANASTAAAGQRCAALEARTTTLEAKVAAQDARIAALEARKVTTFRAAGNLPTLALNGTAPVTCPWTSAVPSPLPTVDQCQTFVAGSATPTVTAVTASGVTVSLKAIAALLPAPGAVQVMATTLNKQAAAPPTVAGERRS